ncbi:uncharacterized protein FIBRA_07274 [Fibroporia radiculosa]|uniref:Very-long-chain (3R)-3-hydroxyacyl-CoA dehydratase n=1 Tax=Fibroporia radiculosa TaxID=599839 RepID=J4GDZ6_9APHY|nr:uncharacterized protein FIBRA_07274 [Fibroporia radiculosa]CCM05068.1 predicted protein [Fibroporia radiculosa]
MLGHAPYHPQQPPPPPTQSPQTAAPTTINPADSNAINPQPPPQQQPPAAFQSVLRLRDDPPPVTNPAPSRSRKRKTPPSAHPDSQQPTHGPPPPPGPPIPPPGMHHPPGMLLPPPHALVPPPHLGGPPIPHGYQYPPTDYSPGGMPPPPPPLPLQDGQSSPGGSSGRTLSQSKRAEQNRKAQRAFRERRDQHVKALESRSQLLDAALASADEANRRWEECRALVDSLRVENGTARGHMAVLQRDNAALRAALAGTGIDVDSVLASAATANPDPSLIEEGQNGVQHNGGNVGPPALVKYYLVLYNVFSAIGWSYVLVLTVAHLSGLDESSRTPPASSLSSLLAQYLPIIPRLTGATHHLERHVSASLIPLFRRACTSYAAVGPQTAVVQTFAVLEVLHSLFGWVRSPLGTTMAQVASRLYLVWGITALFPQTRFHPLYASMVFSWSVTEVVRYTFYAFSLLGSEPHVLLWLRYTLFYILYPTGAGSEAGLIYASLPSMPPSIPFLSSDWYGWVLPLSWPLSTPRWIETLHDDLRCIMFMVWWVGLYVLYTYMIKQRRKVLGAGAGRRLGGKSKTQ